MKFRCKPDDFENEPIFKTIVPIFKIIGPKKSGPNFFTPDEIATPDHSDANPMASKNNLK